MIALTITIAIWSLCLIACVGMCVAAVFRRRP